MGMKSKTNSHANKAIPSDKKHMGIKPTSSATSSYKNHIQKSSQSGENKVQVDQVKQLVTLINDQSVAWYNAEPKLVPRLKHSNAKESKPLEASDELVQTLKKQAQELLELEVKRFETQKSTNLSSDDKYLATMIKSGTLSDRVAALTLTAQASPLHSLLRIGQLISMATKKARRESLLAVESLKNLFLHTFLPDNAKLRYFHQHPLRAAQSSPAHLVLWLFEHCLKTAYAQLLRVLASGMEDAVDNHKRACLRAANALLRAKPEQEAVLLAMLVNKLGDPDRKIAAYLHRMLQELLREHPAMKRVVVDEVERLLTRPKVSDRAKYNAILCLNQLYLEGNGNDVDLARHLITVYFGLFTKAVHGPEAEKPKSLKPKTNGKKLKEAENKPNDEVMDRKLLSALLVGVNRAFPYAGSMTSATLTHEIEALFHVVHKAPHSTSVQALMLLFQVLNSTHSVSDRFYTALYDKLWDPKVRETSKHTLFLNLLFRAIKSDVSPARVSAFLKRLLQVASVMPPAFACAVLFLLSELVKVKPQLRTLFEEPESGKRGEEETFVDVEKEKEKEKNDEEKDVEEEKEEEEKDGEEEEEGEEEERSVKVLARLFGDEKVVKGAMESQDEYDPLKRNPLFARAETSCAWELQLLVHHFHPSVQRFALQLLESGIHYAGDPLVDFTMHAFFEKFVNKKPRYQARGEGRAKAKNWMFVPMNTEAVLEMEEDKVEASDAFFYKFFKERAAREGETKTKRRKRTKEQDADVLSDVEEEEDEEMEAYAQELAEAMMEEGNLDDEDPEMDGWSEEEEGEDGEGEDGEGEEENEEEDDDEGEEEEEEEEEKEKKKKKVGEKRRMMFADAEDYDRIVKEALEKKEEKKKRKLR